MILHIFGKDLLQLGPFLALVAIAQLASAAIWFALGHFEEPRGLVTVAYVFSGATLLGVGALIVCVVQLEIIPGLSQDWLIRPIHRTDLLWAKLLFVLVAVQGPMMLGDFASAFAMGFTVTDSLLSAITRSLNVMLVFALPVFALATMTRSLVQVGAALIVLWALAIALIAAGILVRGGIPPTIAATGLQWMTPAFWSLLAFVAGVSIILVQYWRRSIGAARIIAGAAVLLAPLLSYSSWATAFAIQSGLPFGISSAQTPSIDYDPSSGPAAKSVAITQNGILLPLRVSRLLPDSLLLNDRTYVRLVGPDGATLYAGRSTTELGYGDDFPVRTTTGGSIHAYQRFVFPARVYALLHARSVRMELRYSLTMLQAEGSTSLSTMDSGTRSAPFGWCKTKIDTDGDGIELGCLRPGSVPTCVSATLINPVNGKRNPENFLCDPSYAPFRAQVFPGVMSRLGGELKFRDVQGLAKYPVDSTQLSNARVILKSYQVIKHFSQRLEIPQIRLADWSAAGTAAGD